MRLAQKMIATAVGGALLAVGVVTACSAPKQSDAASAQRAPAADTAAVTQTSAAGELAAMDLPAMTVYKSPTCGCCKGWVQHAKAAGFTVTVHDTADVTPIKQQYGVSDKLRSCHTSVVGGYVIEGHVPAEDIKRLLKERPQIAGLAAPGMPSSAPGMDMGHEPYEVVAFTKDGKTSTWAKH